jgi:hypothetical protein
MQADERAGSPLRVALLLDRPGHGTSPQTGRQKFFASISFSVEASSSVSASSFVLERLQLARVRDLHPAEPGSPLVEGRIADAVLAAHIGRRKASRMLLQHLDDLLVRKSALAHVRLPKERTLPKFGDI